MKHKHKVIVHTSLGKFTIEFDEQYTEDNTTIFILNDKPILTVKDNFVIEWL